MVTQARNGYSVQQRSCREVCTAVNYRMIIITIYEYFDKLGNMFFHLTTTFDGEGNSNLYLYTLFPMQHNLCCDNCHSHVAMALNLMRYDNSSSWNMVKLCFLMLAHSKYVRYVRSQAGPPLYTEMFCSRYSFTKIVSDRKNICGID